MKEVKFRGKKDNGEWIYGYLMASDVICQGFYIDDYIDIQAADPKFVDPETVGQYIGIKDKNGKEIYEGDIIKYGDKTIIVSSILDCQNMDKEKIEVIGDIYH